MKHTILLFILAVVITACNVSSKKNVEPENWVLLFNGENLNGWKAKIAGYPAGENFGNTFRVEDGLLKVSYDAYGDNFNSRFGHLFTEKEYSYYKLRVEYRFYGEGCKNAPGWTYLNNGVMLHCQAPETMNIDQFFPASIEAQLLGSDENRQEPTGSVCTPGTDVFVNGVKNPSHCATSSSKLYPWNEWTTMEIVVLGDSIVHHIIEGDTIMTYTNLTVDGKGLNTETNVIPGPLKIGRIAIQSEGFPTEFRKIELLDLSDQYK
ncbi:hypothetical protein AGMMS49574_14460 [Bacteroidia bacterium]|nr:hypothetical protein AGMMS49574_14460 [Bacteroidia bacterium]GHU55291.1 hypothetical protein FACS189411_03450 [Bacteroidia bacterium]